MPPQEGLGGETPYVVCIIELSHCYRIVEVGVEGSPCFREFVVEFPAEFSTFNSPWLYWMER